MALGNLNGNEMAMIEFWQGNIWVFAASVGFLGLLVGSFLNVVVYRLPKMLMHDWHSQALCFNYSSIIITFFISG